MSQPLGRLARSAGIAAILAVALLAVLLIDPHPAAAGRVFIDPGHGGSFPGAVRHGTREADINLAIARHLDVALRDLGHQTRLSRSSDANVTLSDVPTWSSTDGVWHYAPNGTYNVYDDLQMRCTLANEWGADIFVSIHANAATNVAATGAETFWRNQSTTDRILSERLAACVQQEYVRETGLYNRGVKAGAYYVLRWSNTPAIIVETGFMSNNVDYALLNDPVFQRKAALGIARGIIRFFESEPFSQVYPRISGTNRYSTAVAIAESGWPTDTRGGTVILASGTRWPDALAGTPLAQVLGAPMLLTQSHALPESTRSYIQALAPSNIVVLGGESAIATAVVEAAARASGHETTWPVTERVSGSDRFDTAVSIARRVGIPASGRVIVVSGSSFADALSIAPYAGMLGAPVLLVGPDQIPEVTLGFITENAGAIVQFEIVGGERAVGADVEAELLRYGHVVRVSGTDRYQTNRMVLDAYAADGSIDPLVATGQDFPDALCAGTLGARQGRPVMLVGSRYLPPLTREFLLNNASRTADPTIVGGEAAIPFQMDWMIRKGLER